MKTGILLVNVGTPDDFSPAAVGRYLREFLMDPMVISVPWPVRWFLVNVAIVPRRKHASAKLYRKIWTKDGSPLRVHTESLTRALEALRPGDMVRSAMRYGTPGLKNAIAAFQKEKVTRLVVVPLYPQFSSAATRTSEIAVRKIARDLDYTPELSFVSPFYKNDHYLDAVAAISTPLLRKSFYDLFVFSYHGLPEEQVVAEDKDRLHCLKSEACCEVSVEANRDCYRHQCFETSRLLAERLGIPPLRYVVAFQSRLGKTPWIRPFTDEFYRTLPQRGIKRIAVLCPSFVADCLETLEEVQIRGLEEFKRHGGHDLKLVPSLNAEPVWVEALSKIIDPYFAHQPKT